MKGVLSWLGTLFSRRSVVVETKEPKSPGVVQSFEQGQDVPMPDIYGDDDDVTQPTLKALDESTGTNAVD